MTTTPSPHDLPALVTADDVLERVTTLIGPAARDGTLWLLFVDGDGRQAPVVAPIDDVPPLPDDMMSGLGKVLAGILPDLATDAGPGAVVFVRERRGPDVVRPADRIWAEVLTTLCRAHRFVLRGIYLSTPGGVRSL